MTYNAQLLAYADLGFVFTPNLEKVDFMELDKLAEKMKFSEYYPVFTMEISFALLERGA